MRVLAAILALSSLACAAGAAPVALPPHFAVFVDRTESITARERAIWHRESQVIVDALEPGSSVDIFELHDRTVEAGALLSATSFLPPADATMHEIMRGRTELKALRERVAAALEAAFAAPVKSRGTDVLGFIERVRLYHDRATRVVLFTDAVHETKHLNLAKLVIVEDQVTNIASAMLRDRPWAAASLRGGDVFFVLNSSAAGESAGRNSRRVLRAFYADVVAASGGRLSSFETTLAGHFGGRSRQSGLPRDSSKSEQ